MHAFLLDLAGVISDELLALILIIVPCDSCAVEVELYYRLLLLLYMQLKCMELYELNQCEWLVPSCTAYHSHRMHDQLVQIREESLMPLITSTLAL